MPDINWTIDHLREGFVLVDEANNYLLSNPAAARMLPGLSKLREGDVILSSGYWPEALNGLESGNMEFSLGGEVPLPRHFRASVSPVFDESHILIAKIILFSDVTEDVILIKKLENAAYIDALTGLYNRKHFFELAVGEIERALRLDNSIYAAMLDIDFFKKVNDTYGHDAGDRVLKAVAEAARRSIRSYDLLCRYGGEEFVFLFSNLEPEEAPRLAERIRRNMEKSVTKYEGKEIKVTCSLGFARFLEGDTLEMAVKKSDEALYAAKNAGRNQVKMYELPA